MPATRRVLGPVWEPGGAADSERNSEIALDDRLAAAERAAKRLKDHWWRDQAEMMREVAWAGSMLVENLDR